MSSASYMNISDTTVSYNISIIFPFRLTVLGDKYVNFDCSKLVGYDQVKAKIEGNPDWGISIEGICGSNSLGKMHDLNFPYPSDYSKDMGEDRTQYYPAAFDYHSIMIYASGDFAGDPAGGVKDLPLVRWKNGRPKDGKVDDSTAEIIPWPNAISDRDKEGIVRLYPWN
jgi:hypothetical protein